MEKLDKYLEKLKMEYEDIEVMEKKEIKEITKDYDDEVIKMISVLEK